MVWVITGVLALLVLLALPAKAESADYETTLDRLGRLQALAEQYIEEKNSGDDPIDLTLSFTRVGDYNTTVWQLTAGTRDGEFEKYATDADPDLWDLQGMNTVELPNGVVNDEYYVLEYPIHGDVALVKAEKGDRWGNLTYRMSARNFGPVCAMAAQFTVATVHEIVELGELDPEAVVTPGIFVSQVVKVPRVATKAGGIRE